jgi:uncharacterized protein (DUF1697 family)
VRYAALLRGINVGGHRKIKMTDLAAYFGEMGFTDVTTLIASGNVLFAAPEQDEAALEAIVERALATSLGYDVDVMVRSVARLRELRERDPFPPMGPDEHAYVSMLKRVPPAVPDLPATFPDEGFSVLAVDDREVFFMTRKLANGRHGDPAKFLKRSLGKIPATVRNWNTIVKMSE